MTHVTPIQKLFKTIKESVFGRSVKGVGVCDVGKDGIDGVIDTIKDSMGTLEVLKEAGLHPIRTSTFIAKSIADSYERDMVNGNAESRSHWVTYALGTTATKAAVQKSVTTTQNAMQSLRTLELPQPLSYGPHLELATPDGVPF